MSKEKVVHLYVSTNAHISHRNSARDTFHVIFKPSSLCGVLLVRLNCNMEIHLEPDHTVHTRFYGMDTLPGRPPKYPHLFTLDPEEVTCTNCLEILLKQVTSKL